MRTSLIIIFVVVILMQLFSPISCKPSKRKESESKEKMPTTMKPNEKKKMPTTMKPDEKKKKSSESEEEEKEKPKMTTKKEEMMMTTKKEEEMMMTTMKPDDEKMTTMKPDDEKLTTIAHKMMMDEAKKTDAPATTKAPEKPADEPKPEKPEEETKCKTTPAKTTEKDVAMPIQDMPVMDAEMTADGTAPMVAMQFDPSKTRVDEPIIVSTVTRMSDEMQRDAVSAAREGFRLFKDNEYLVAKHIVSEFDAKYGPYWHCSAGESYEAYFTFEKDTFIRMSKGKIHLQLYKHFCSD